MSCRKMYTTMNTRMKASINVLITSWMEAKRKSLALCAMLMPRPAGMDDCISSNTFSRFWMVAVALVPAIW